MTSSTRSGLIGAGLIGVGFGLTAVGIALVVPVCANWSLSIAQQAVKKGRERVEDAAAALGEFSARTQQRFGEAAQTAKARTSQAAGAVENAARHVREYTS